MEDKNKQPGRVEKTAQTAISKTAGKAIGQKIAQTAAAKAIGSALGSTLGSAVPLIGNIVGGIVGGLVGTAATKGIKGIAKTLGTIPLALTNGLWAIGGAVGVAVSQAINTTTTLFIGTLTLLAFLTALILFIINSGAYVAPSGGTAFSAGIVASGTCPLTGKTYISTPSYDPATENGHGGNIYWNNVAQYLGTEKCSFDIPIGNMYPGCRGPSDSVAGASDNICNQTQTNLCPYYGYAADVVSDNNAVFLPTLCGAGSVTCPSMNWTLAASFVGDSGGGAIFTSSDNGYAWRIALIHINLSPIGQGTTIPSGTQIGTLYDWGQNTHLHIELSINGVPVRPDFMCGGTEPIPAGTTNGYIVKIQRSDLDTLVASSVPEYGQQTCAWASGKSLKYAFNANFYNPNTARPEAPAGYQGSFSNDTPIQNEGAAFMTFVLDNANNPQIIGGPNSGGYFFDQLPPSLENLSQYRLVVTGVTHDSFVDQTVSRPRTVIGIDNQQNVYLGVFPSTTVFTALQQLNQAGAMKSFHLDGGGSSTFCEDGNPIIGNTRNVGNSIGTNAGVIITGGSR